MDITSENLGIPETEYSATVGPPCPALVPFSAQGGHRLVGLGWLLASRRPSARPRWVRSALDLTCTKGSTSLSLVQKGGGGLWAWRGCRPPGDRALGRGAVGRRPAARVPPHACGIALPLTRPAHTRPAPPRPAPHTPPPPRCACPPPSSSASPRTCPASGTRVGGPVQHRVHGWVGRRGELRPVGFALEARDTQAPVSARASPPPAPPAPCTTCSACCRSRGQRDPGRQLLVSGLKSSFLPPCSPPHAVEISVTKDGIKFSTSGDIGSASVICRQAGSPAARVPLALPGPCRCCAAGRPPCSSPAPPCRPAAGKAALACSPRAAPTRPPAHPLMARRRGAATSPRSGRRLT